ncbi:methyl-accepting chemotaxis protein [Gallaecimonas xiamenensis]|uniref:Methyl-accepting chemotaxis protein n=1 Tax=Gallaecimonas xiamenensis 3-C-1 TaxID=745411 RepID=K2IWL2_9GAMM|nr:methyl-accepting chemotaxis protein [Gallaecimonas xiamenensis]EKE74876.1 methyl-accepting chemotaxis protein [Gallaecimonas xiamenensis 3-C-1]
MAKSDAVFFKPFTLLGRRLAIRLSITQKVMLGFLMLVLCLLVGSLVTLLAGRQIQNQTSAMTDKATPLVLQTSQLSVILLNADRQLKAVPGSQDSHLAITTLNNFDELQSDFDQALGRLKTLALGSAELLSLIEPLDNLDQDYFALGKELGQKQLALLQSLDDLTRARQDWHQALAEAGGDPQLADAAQQALGADDSFALSGPRRLLEAASPALAEPAKRLLDTKENSLTLAQDVRDLADQSGGSIDYAIAVLGTVDQTAHDRVTQGAKAVRQSLSLSFWLSLLTLGVSLLLALGVAVSIYRSIKKPLAELLAVQGAAVQGDMTRSVNFQSHNEFGLLSSSTNQLLEHLRQLLGQLSQGAQQLAQVSELNRNQSVETRQALEQQRQQTQQVTVAMTEMEKAVQEVAQAAALTLSRVLDMEQAVAKGQTRVKDGMALSQQLAGQLSSAGQAIDEVESFSQRIGGVLDVIQGVAEQTNLLALNAAIEAARAGDHGRGFAVVASEVRGLAQQTAESAKTIHGMIDNLQRSTQGAVSLMAQCHQEMDKGLEQSQLAAQAMGDIQALIREVSGNSEQIATAAAQQQATTEDIALSLSQIADITERNHQGVAAFTDSSRQIEDLVLAQDQLVRRFQR